MYTQILIDHHSAFYFFKHKNTCPIIWYQHDYGRISSLLEDSFAKETYNFQKPTHRAHLISSWLYSWLLRSSNKISKLRVPARRTLVLWAHDTARPDWGIRYFHVKNRPTYIEKRPINRPSTKAKTDEKTPIQKTSKKPRRVKRDACVCTSLRARCLTAGVRVCYTSWGMCVPYVSRHA